MSEFSYPERLARLRLARSKNIGSLTFSKMISRFGSGQEAIKYLLKSSSKLKDGCPSLEDTELELKKLDSLKGQFIFLGEGLYPHQLAMISDPPPVISVKGNDAVINKLPDLNIFGIVGARSCSLNGARFSSKISKELAEKNITVVSGLARGIDTHAHKGTLEADGITIAVIACSLDMPPYPPENESLHNTILERGLIISEMPFSTPPQSSLFPRRNRIIAGLSRGILVVEATVKSGSLITAKYAIDYNRDVFAVPGSPLDPRCWGTNNLLKSGAIFTQSSEDIFENYPTIIRPIPQTQPQQQLFEEMPQPATPEIAEPSNDKEQILEMLSSTATLIEDLSQETDLPINQLLSILCELELENKIVIENGQQVTRLG